MDRLITLLLALAFAGSLAGGVVYAWDRHPPVHYVLPWWTGHLHIGLPDSLQTRYEQASADAVTWKAAYASEASALQAQEKAQEALDAAGAVKLAKAAQLPSMARKSASAAILKRDAISQAAKPSDPVCERAQETDRVFLRELGR